MIWDATKVPTNECYGSGYISVARMALSRRRASASIPNCIDVGIIGYYGGGLLSAATSDVLSTVRLCTLYCRWMMAEVPNINSAPRSKSHDIFLYEMSGSCSSRLCANGRFIISPGDTIPANLMIESRRYIVAVDGHLPADTTTVQFYRWYATGEDIPFAVQVRREGYSECLFMISEITEKLTDSDDDDYGGDDAAKVRELLDNIKVSVGHDTVSISLGQFDGSCAEAYLVDIPGNIHGCTSSRLDEQENIIDIPLYGLPAGDLYACGYY